MAFNHWLNAVFHAFFRKRSEELHFPIVCDTDCGHIRRYRPKTKRAFVKGSFYDLDRLSFYGSRLGGFGPVGTLSRSRFGRI